MEVFTYCLLISHEFSFVDGHTHTHTHQTQNWNSPLSATRSLS